jgi:hypothetical protein
MDFIFKVKKCSFINPKSTGYIFPAWFLTTLYPWEGSVQSSLDIIRWVAEKGGDVTYPTIVEHALVHGDIATVTYLHESEPGNIKRLTRTQILDFLTKRMDQEYERSEDPVLVCQFISKVRPEVKYHISKLAEKARMVPRDEKKVQKKQEVAESRPSK